ncbi:unnamed protein product [Lampetra planeri]
MPQLGGRQGRGAPPRIGSDHAQSAAPTGGRDGVTTEQERLQRPTTTAAASGIRTRRVSAAPGRDAARRSVDWGMFQIARLHSTHHMDTQAREGSQRRLGESEEGRETIVTQGGAAASQAQPAVVSLPGVGAVLLLLSVIPIEQFAVECFKFADLDRAAGTKEARPWVAAWLKGSRATALILGTQSPSPTPALIPANPSRNPITLSEPHPKR